MAAANESQGLKIAVAAFIALTVILTVTSYFLYSAYSSADARQSSSNEEVQNKSKAASLALTHPEARDRLNALARKLNVERSFPYHLIKRVTASPP